MNDINIGETFYILAKERGQKEAKYFLNVILPRTSSRNFLFFQYYKLNLKE